MNGQKQAWQFRVTFHGSFVSYVAMPAPYCTLQVRHKAVAEWSLYRRWHTTHNDQFQRNIAGNAIVPGTVRNVMTTFI